MQVRNAHKPPCVRCVCVRCVCVCSMAGQGSTSFIRVLTNYCHMEKIEVTTAAQRTRPQQLYLSATLSSTSVSVCVCVCVCVRQKHSQYTRSLQTASCLCCSNKKLLIGLGTHLSSHHPRVRTPVFPSGPSLSPESKHIRSSSMTGPERLHLQALIVMDPGL